MLITRTLRVGWLSMLDSSRKPFAGATRVWLQIGLPIMGLLLVCILGAFAIMWDLARQQDSSFVRSSRALVSSVNAERKVALARSVLDFGSWNDAYRHITQRWNRKWVERNYTSSSADGILLFRDNQVRHIWAPDTTEFDTAELRKLATDLSSRTAAFHAAAAGANAAERVRTDFAIVGGRLVLLAISPVGWEPDQEAILGPAESRDFVALIDILEDDKLGRFGRAVGLEDLRFTPASGGATARAELTSIPVLNSEGGLLGRFEWVRVRPGTQNFARDIWPIGIGLLLCGLLAVAATRRLVLHQLEATARADRALQNLRAYQIALDEHAVVVMIDCDGFITFVNDRYLALTGMRREELVGLPQDVLRFNDHSAEYYDEIQRCVGAGQSWRGEVCNRDRNGNVYWLDTAVIPQAPSADVRGGIVFVAYEITDRKLAEEAASRRAAADSLIAEMQSELLASGSFHQSLARAIDEIASTYGARCGAVWELLRSEHHGAWAALIALSRNAEPSLGDAAPVIRFCGEDDTTRRAAKHFEGGAPMSGLVASQIGALELRGLPIVAAGEILGALALDARALNRAQCIEELRPFLSALGDLMLAQREADRRRDAERMAQNQARHDALTGLGNRRLLMEEFELRTDHPAAKFALILIDLDRFKPINDVHGHLIGDQVLQIIAARLREIAPRDSAIVRLGGDEFAVLTDATAAEVDLRALAADLLAAITQPIHVANLHLSVGASIGVARYPQDAMGSQELLYYADAAMYRAKERRGDVQFFDAVIDEGIRKRAEIEAQLRDAIEAGEIAPYFQPILSLQTHEIVGHEVLARWRHPLRGFIPPSVFIPIAEEAGLIDALFWRLLREACAAHKQAGATTLLSVNISPSQIRDAMFPQRLLQTLTEIGFPCGLLEVEVTESSMLGDIERARPLLMSLKNQGVRIALDDFGTGYSSLLMLRDLPLDKVKIDQSFVRGLSCHTDADATIIDAVLGMASALKLEVVAEGIENGEVARLLRAKGCHYGQGYLFGFASPRIDAYGEVRSVA